MFSKSVIISLTHKVAFNLTRNKREIQGKVVEVMGGQVIELDVIKARREERERSIKIFIEDKLEDSISKDVIQRKLEDKYSLCAEEAMAYIEKYSNIKTA